MIPEVVARDALTSRLRASRCVHDADHGGAGVAIGIAQTDLSARLSQHIVHQGLWRVWISDERPSRLGYVFWEPCASLGAPVDGWYAIATRRIPRPCALPDCIDDRLAFHGFETWVVSRPMKKWHSLHHGHRHRWVGNVISV